MAKWVGLGQMQSTVQCVSYAVKNRYWQNLGRATWSFDSIFGGALGAFQVAGLRALLVAVFSGICFRQRAWAQQYYLYQ